jgi:mono/diheme cytochrome c family protein
MKRPLKLSRRNLNLLIILFLLSFVVSASNASSTGTVSSETRLETGAVVPVPDPTSSLYEARCARCHGSDGRGDTVLGRSLGAPDFTEGKWKASHSVEEMVSVVSSGKEGMPAFGRRLTRRQISSLVSYVKNLN